MLEDSADLFLTGAGCGSTGSTVISGTGGEAFAWSVPVRKPSRRS